MFILFFVFSISSFYGNKIYYEEADLKKMAEFSGLILVVKPKSPFINLEKKVIKASGKKKYSGHAFEFKTNSYNFEVVKVLKNSGDSDLTGKQIKIYPAFTLTKLELQKKYNFEGVAKSPIYESYKSSIKSEKDLEKESIIIVFIAHIADSEIGKNIYQLIFENGYERFSYLSEIEKLVK